MKNAKFVLIGAGSSLFTTSVLDGLFREGVECCRELGLVDVNADTLAIVERLARKAAAQVGADVTISASTNRLDLLDGADAVAVSISVGGDEAWENDLKIPHAHGVVQPTGDSVGIGGMSRAFRHVPEVVEIARDMEALCPDAVLFNYTNPMTAVCRAVARESSIRCVGLCSGADVLRRHLSHIAGAEPDRTWLWAAGINHFLFAYRFLLDGTDAYPLVDARVRQAQGESVDGLAELIAGYPSSSAEADQPVEVRNPFCTDLYQHIGFYPGPDDRRTAEFLPQFFRLEEDLEQYGIAPFDIASRKLETSEFLAGLRAAVDSDEPLDSSKLVALGEGSQAVEILRAVREGSRGVFTVNLPNWGQIANLPDDCIVESPALATLDGLKPLVFGELPEPVLSWTKRWLEWCELVVDTSLTGDRRKALQCLAADPGCTALSTSQEMLRELIEANEPYLRQFGPE